MNRVTEPIFPPGRYPAIYIGKEGCVKKPKPNTRTCIAQKGRGNSQDMQT